MAVQNVGKALYALRIDESLRALFAQQLEAAVDAVEGGQGDALKPELQLVVGLAFYGLSFLLPRPGVEPGTAGMRHFQLVPRAFLRRGDEAPARSTMLLPVAFLLAVYAYQRAKRASLMERWHLHQHRQTQPQPQPQPQSQQPPSPSQQPSLHARLGALDTAAKLLALGNCLSYLSGRSYPDLLLALSPGFSSVLPSPFAAGAGAGAGSVPGLAALVFVQYHRLLWGAAQSLVRAAALGRGQALLLLRRARWQLGAARAALGAWFSPGLARVTGGRGSSSSSSSNSSSTGGASGSAAVGALALGSLRAQSAQGLRCAACRTSPPEAPHAPACGHAHCYVCLCTGIAQAGASASAGARTGVGSGAGAGAGAGEGEGEGWSGLGEECLYLCPACGRAGSECTRWLPRTGDAEGEDEGEDEGGGGDGALLRTTTSTV